MKAILISDHAKWCSLMMNGDKTKEIRKNKSFKKAVQSLINEYGFAWIYVYCSKDSEYLLHKNCVDIYWLEDRNFKAKNKKLGIETQPSFNGKVIFRFKCYKVEDIRPFFHWCESWKNSTCLSRDEVLDYLDSKDKSVGNPKRQGEVYALEISKLEIFDKPREVTSFFKFGYENWCKKTSPIKFFFEPEKCREELEKFKLTKAPQSWCYIESED